MNWAWRCGPAAASVVMAAVLLAGVQGAGATTFGVQDLFVYEQISAGSQDLTGAVLDYARLSPGRSVPLPDGSVFIESTGLHGRIEDTGLGALDLMHVNYGIFRHNGVDKFGVLVSPDVGTSQEAYLGPLDLISTDLTPVFDAAGVPVGAAVTTRAKLAASRIPSNPGGEAGLDELDVLSQRAFDTGLVGLGDPNTGHAYELVYPGRVADAGQDNGKKLRVAGKGLVGLGVFLASGDGLWGAAGGLATFDGLMLMNIADEVDKGKPRKKRDNASYNIRDGKLNVTMNCANPYTANFGDVSTYPMTGMGRYTFEFDGFTTTVVPEPTSLLLVALGATGLLRRGARTRSVWPVA